MTADDSMILQLDSFMNDSRKYNEVEFDFISPWNCQKVEYKVISLNFILNSLVTIGSDYLDVYYESNLGDQTARVMFSDKCDYDMDDLLQLIQDLLNYQISFEIFIVTLTDYHILRFVTSDVNQFCFIGATPRVQSLLRLINVNINLITKIVSHESPSSLMICHGNLLYLESRNGLSLISSYATFPVLYRINRFMKQELPILVNEKNSHQDKITVDIDSISLIKIVLMNMNHDPVSLLNPMFVTLKIEPIYK
jgi:hypothetical protein